MDNYKYSMFTMSFRWEMLVSNNSVGKDAWLKGFSYSTFKLYRKGFGRFIKFMNETEEGDWNDKRLLKEREIHLKERNYAFEQKVVDFHRWLGKLPKELSDNSKKTYVASICSFFAFHRMELKFTKQQRNQLWRRPRPVKKYYDFTLDDLKRMSKVANTKERYVLLVGKSLGLRASDFLKLKQGTFEAHLDEKPPISLGEVFTKKKGVKAHPFLDEDAAEASRTWLQVLESKNMRNPDAPVLNIGHLEIDLIIKKLAKRAGINTGNEIVRFHQLRVFLITRLSTIMETNRWKQIVGKRVPESSYVKPFNLREDYAKVMEYTTIRERVAQEKVKRLEDEVKTLREKESISRGEVDILKHKLKVLEEQLKELQKGVEKIGKRQEKSLLEIYGGGEPPSKELTELTEEIDENEEESELQ